MRQARILAFTSAVLLTAGLASLAAGAANDRSVSAPDAMLFTAPGIKQGLEARFTGRKLSISPGAIWVNDKPINVPRELAIDIPACPMVTVKDEPVKLVAEPLKGPASASILHFSRASENDRAALEGVVVPGSVRVTLKPDDEKNFLKPNVDYLLDANWGALVKGPSSAIKANQTVYVDYVYFTRRLDTLTIDESGHVRLWHGQPARSAPMPPVVRDDLLRLANFHAEPGNEKMKPEDFLPISARPAAKTPVELRKRNAAALARTRAKLEAGQKVNIVFWGDSITSGADASVIDKNFYSMTLAGLKKKYPKAVIVAHNAGIGGSNTKSRLPKMDTEVLSKKPDLIIIEFINDVYLKKEDHESNYKLILEKAKAAGAEILLVNPGLPAPRLMGVPNWKSVMKMTYYPFVRTLAESSNIALADVELRYEKLDKEGLTPDLLLVDRLIHPNDLGHAIYAQEILKAFQ
jgi:lysophospholipase L1-like esterase